MATKQFVLKIKDNSPIQTFVKWYADYYTEVKEESGRKMKGKSNEFIIKFLEHALTNNGVRIKEDMEKINTFISFSSKTQEEKDAEIAFKNHPEKLKTWKQLQKDIDKANKG